MLGTGSAFPTESYNACAVLCDKGLRLLIDSGGGNGILRQLGACGIDPASLHHFFVTHSHTDHILGAVWVIRAIINARLADFYEGSLKLYGNPDVLATIDTICRLTLLDAHYRVFRELTEPIDVTATPDLEMEGVSFRFFDVGSRNVCQTGFRSTLSDGREVVFLGDESLTDTNIEDCRGADTVVCGAFCRHADADHFRPYEKHHHTVRDVARVARRADIRRLVLIHSEDTDLSHRQAVYAAEAAEYGFTGPTITPADGDTIEL